MRTQIENVLSTCDLRSETDTVLNALRVGFPPALIQQSDNRRVFQGQIPKKRVSDSDSLVKECSSKFTSAIRKGDRFPAYCKVDWHYSGDDQIRTTKIDFSTTTYTGVEKNVRDFCNGGPFINSVSCEFLNQFESPKEKPSETEIAECRRNKGIVPSYHQEGFWMCGVEIDGKVLHSEGSGNSEVAPAELSKELCDLGFPKDHEVFKSLRCWSADPNRH